MIPLSPPGVVPVRYAGGVILQDSKTSLAVSATFDASTWSPYAMVQMYLCESAPRSPALLLTRSSRRCL